MFKTKAKTNEISAKGQNPNSNATTVIGQGTALEGSFSSNENVRFDGQLKGELKCQKLLVMGEHASIDGDVTANEATIMGKIKGEVTIQEKLTLKSTAFIEGNIKAKTLVVEEGARYVGNCKIGND
ncbi:MAG: hypothetical protein KatS3mg029_0128 [Saprospiraceae bacterium]|nr:MAG: hypothetical protein KatS3mg029_0128 [Saprospiraceae bacterium]